MPEATAFTVIIVSPDSIVYEGEVTRMLVPGHNLELAILPNHTPLYAQLNAGQISLNPTTGAPKNFKIDGGIIRVKRNRVSIIVGFDILRQ